MGPCLGGLLLLLGCPHLGPRTTWHDQGDDDNDDHDDDNDGINDNDNDDDGGGREREEG